MKLFESFKKSDKGASLVLVTVFSTIVIGIVVTLTVISAMLLSKAGKIKSQDQAYELATSLEARLEYIILNPNEDGTQESGINLDAYFNLNNPEDQEIILLSESGFDSIPDSSVLAEVKWHAEENYFTLKVTATAAKETHIVTSDYLGDATNGYKRR